MVKKPSIFHSQDLQPHLPEVIICTFSLLFYFLFFPHFFLNFSADILVSCYYYSPFLLQAILHVFSRTFVFVVLISTQQWQFGYKHWKDNQRQEKRKLHKWEEILHHLLWVFHSSCLSYGLPLLMPWSQWRELNPFPREFRAFALEVPTSLFSICTVPAELCHFTLDTYSGMNKAEPDIF